MLLAAVLSVAVLGLSSCTDAGDAQAGASPVSSPEAAVTASDPAARALVERIAEASVGDYRLRGLIVRATRDGAVVAELARGESLPGVPATPDMTFRNGAMAFTYLAQTYLRLADEGVLGLDDTVGRWLPDLPLADQVTIRQLLSMTSGYPDYVVQPALQTGAMSDPFREWTDDELVRIGLADGQWFAPGTGWAYSHTNYVILGQLLTAITGKPVDEVLAQYVMDPMGLAHTGSNDDTPAMPEPVMHVYSSEQRGFLDLPATTPFSVESTFWNPSWTTAKGAVQTTDVRDMTRSMEIIGSGSQLSPEGYAALTKGNVGLGKADPSGRCVTCRQMTEAADYGLGVTLNGDWITQTKNFAGSGATTGYLPQERLAITVVTTYLPSAFAADGGYENQSRAVFFSLAEALAPGSVPAALRP